MKHSGKDDVTVQLRIGLVKVMLVLLKRLKFV